MSLLRKFHVMNMRINGFYGARASWWLSAKQYDEKYNTKHTASQKKWAYKNGFLPSVVERYGINDANRQDFISLYDCCQFLFRDQGEIAQLKPPDSTPPLSVSGLVYNLSSHP